MMIAGDFIFSRFTFDAMFETVPEIILWRAVVPSCMTATGVFLSMPPDKSCLQITPIRARPIIITIVSHAFAMRFHLIDSVRFDGSSCPVTKTTDDERLRCVKGMPEYVADPDPDVIPGMISYFICEISNIQPPRHRAQTWQDLLPLTLELFYLFLHTLPSSRL